MESSIILARWPQDVPRIKMRVALLLREGLEYGDLLRQLRIEFPGLPVRNYENIMNIVSYSLFKGTWEDPF